MKDRNISEAGRTKLLKVSFAPPALAPALFAFTLIVTASLPMFAQNKDKDKSTASDNDIARIASHLLRQIREGLEGRSPKKMLAAFDLAKMENGQNFKQQIAGLFTRTEAIRVHLNLVEAVGEEQHATILVDAEMEAEPRDNSLLARKHASLTLTAEKTAAGWKFTSVEPRSFFSLEP